MVKRHIRAFAGLGLCVLLLISKSAFAEVKSSLDRSRVTLDETLNYTITVTGDNDAEPVTAPLEKDFQILSQRQNSQISWINGEVSSNKIWSYLLAPKRTGQLLIPPLAVGREQTRAHSLLVTSGSSGKSAGGDIFLDVTASSTSVAVQQELEIVVRLYSAVGFSSATLDQLDVPSALVEGPRENQFNSEVNGRWYQVNERRYSVFPQQSGKLEIPSLVFQANVDSPRRSLLDPGRMLRKRSSPLQITVTPPVNNYSGSHWLPAKKLDIIDQWSDDPEDLTVGDSVTRSITIRATGLLGKQLPPLEMPELRSLRRYPDQAKTSNDFDSGALIGQRIESEALVPMRPGTLQLPAVEITWWDTENGVEKTARLPATTLKVKPKPSVGGGPTTAAETTAGKPAPSIQTTAPHADTWLWISAVLALLLVLQTIVIIVLLKRRTGPSTAIAISRATSKDGAMPELKRALETGEPMPIRAALQQWVREEFTLSSLPGLEDIQRLCPELAAGIQALESSLFSTQADGGNAAELIRQALPEARKRAAARTTKSSAKQDLPPLYPG